MNLQSKNILAFFQNEKKTFLHVSLSPDENIFSLYTEMQIYSQHFTVIVYSAILKRSYALVSNKAAYIKTTIVQLFISLSF